MTLATIQQGPGDAACCPSQKAHQGFELQGDALVEVTRAEQGRVSADDLAGTGWLLESLASGHVALPTPSVTLEIDGDALVGSAGCNRYRADFIDAERNFLEIGPAVATRAICGPLVQAQQEDEFLAKLGAVSQFSIVNGRLNLFYQLGDVTGTLDFRAQAAEGEMTVLSSSPAAPTTSTRSSAGRRPTRSRRRGALSRSPTRPR